MYSTAASVHSPGGEGQMPSPSTEGTPTTSPIASGVVQIPDESGSSTTATSIGGTTAKRGSASITTRGEKLCVNYIQVVNAVLFIFSSFKFLK